MRQIYAQAAATVRQLAEDMTPKTWRKLRGELLALVAGETMIVK